MFDIITFSDDLHNFIKIVDVTTVTKESVTGKNPFDSPYSTKAVCKIRNLIIGFERYSRITRNRLSFVFWGVLFVFFKRL